MGPSDSSMILLTRHVPAPSWVSGFWSGSPGVLVTLLTMCWCVCVSVCVCVGVCWWRECGCVCTFGLLWGGCFFFLSVCGILKFHTTLHTRAYWVTHKQLIGPTDA